MVSWSVKGECKTYGDNDVLVFHTGQVRENVGKWLVMSDKVKETTLTLSDINEGSLYEFRVSAVNKAGQGPASAASDFAKYGQLSTYLVYIIILNISRNTNT